MGETEEIINVKYWCDKCRLTYNQNISNPYHCDKCGNIGIHRLLVEKDNADIILVTEENYKDVLPEDLIYFYNQLKYSSTQLYNKVLLSYSISKDAISKDLKMWFKSK